jgi:hypothetical protein
MNVGFCLAATDRTYNFQLISLCQLCSVELAAWHDFAVALYRQALTDQLKMLHKFGYGEISRFKTAGFAIDRD